MVEYENSSGLLAGASARAGGESRSLKASRAARLALTAALLSSTALVAAAPAHAATATWTGGGLVASDWDGADNWGGTLPNIGDDIVIPGAPAAPVSPIFSGVGVGNTEANPINSLTVEGGLIGHGLLTISGGTLNVTDAVKLANGGIINSGQITINTGAGLRAATLNIESGPDSEFKIVNGTATFTGASTVNAGKLTLDATLGNATLKAEGGLTVSGGAVNVNGVGIGEGQLFVGKAGAGDLTIASTAGTITIGAGGFVDVAGSAELNRGVSNAGKFRVANALDLRAGEFSQSGGSALVTGLTSLGTTASDATLKLDAGTFTAEGGLEINGKGALNLVGGVFTVGKDAAAANLKVVAGSGLVNIAGGTLDVKGDATFNRNASNAGTFKVGQSLNLTEGTFNQTGITSATTVKGATLLGSADKIGTLKLDGGEFNAEGGLTVNTQGTLDINGGAVNVGKAGAPANLAIAAGGNVTLDLANATDKGLVVIGGLDIDGVADTPSASPIVLNKGAVDVTGTAGIANRSVTLGNGAGAASLTVRKADSDSAAKDGTLTVSGKGSVTLAHQDSRLQLAEVALVDATSSLVFGATADKTATAYKISGAGGVEVKGSVELNKDNTFTGGVTLGTHGNLSLNDLSSIGAEGSRKLVFDGGEVTFGSDIASDAGVEFARKAADSAISVTASAGAHNTFNVDQKITGVGLVQVGATTSAIALTNEANDFVGAVGVTTGTLKLSKLATLGKGVETVNPVPGGDPIYVRTLTIADNAGLAIAGTEIASSDGVSLSWGANGSLAVLDAAHQYTLKQNFGGNGTLTANGAGTLVLAGTNSNTALAINSGTVAAEARTNLGAAGGVAVTINEGFLKVGQKTVDSTTVGIADDTNLTLALTTGKAGGFDVDADRSFIVNGNIAGDGTLVKKGDGTLALRGAGNSQQVNNLVQAGTLSVTTADQLGSATKKVTFAGGALGIGDGVAAATLANDASLNLFWGGANSTVNATIDVAKESSFTIDANAFGKYDTFDPVTGDPLPTKSTVTGALVKKGEGTLVLANADIAYTGGTVVEAGTLKVDATDTKFRFKDGKYTVNGGKLEADVSDLTITELAGSGKTGAEILDGDNKSYDPKRYALNAGEIVVASGVADDALSQKSKTLTVNQTTGDTGFWGKIVGFFGAGVDAEQDPRALQGKLVVAADAGKQVVLTGNASEVGTVEVAGGTLRVNNGVLPVSNLLGAPTTTHNGSLTANSVAVNGTETNRASLAGSGKIVAPVSVGQYGSLLGNQAGTLTIQGDVTFAEGATVELGNFIAHHNTAGTTEITNQYFHVDGTLKAADAGTLVNLNNDAIDPGVYRVFSSTKVIENGAKFALGTIGDLPAQSITLGLSGEDKNLDLFAATGRAGLRYWNGTATDGTSTWTVNGADWTDLDKSQAGRLQRTVDSSAVGVFGYTGFPQQGGTVNVSANPEEGQYLTQGLQFFSSDWLLTGAALELKGGAAGTDYAGKTTIDTGAGNIVINNQLTGSAALRKTGVGALSLWGDNTYAGGTIIEGGTLNVAADAHLGAAGTSVTLNGAGATLALAQNVIAGTVARDIVVNLPSNTSGSVNLASTINLGGNSLVAGGLTGNGYLNLTNGVVSFAGNNAVNFGGSVNVAVDATLGVNGVGSIGSANVAGSLLGSFGHTLAIDNLTLANTAKIGLSLPAAANGAVTAFKGTNAVLDGEISLLSLPQGYSVGTNGTSLFVFDYANRSGEIAISDAVKAQYADSNFTFGGVVNGYLVLNSKTTPAPQPGVGETVNVDRITNLKNWTETTFVDGQLWNNGVATFNGTGTNKPINVEGQVRIAGLTINGQNFLFKDAGVAGSPGAFLLQAAAGTSVVDLTVAANGSATIAIPVAGADFAKKGAGQLVLAGNSTDFTGTGTVQQGALHVTGNFSNGTFAVTGGELRVNGTVKQVTVGPNGSLEGLFSGLESSRGVNIGTLIVNGGTVKPGNSPGTLRVGGLSQTAGVIQFERGDKIEVLRNVGGTPNGQAIFSKAANGAQVDLRLTTDTRSYTYGNAYTFVTAENGVTFTTADAVKVTEVGNGRLFSSFAAAAQGQNGVFYLKRDRNFATQAWSGNHLAVAGALESMTPADLRSSRGAIYDAIASASNDEAHLVRAAFDQLSGEIHASAQGVLIDESRHLREATINRTRAALSGSASAAPGQVVQAPAGANVALWGQAYGSWGETGSTSQSAKLDRSTGGFVLGLDTAVADTWRLGIAGGYAKSDIKSNSNLSKADVDNYNLAVYGGSQFGDLGLRFGLGHTWHRLDTERQLNVLGLRDSNQAKYDARTLQLYAEAGYEVKFEAATVEPFLNLAYVNHHTDSFVERGTGLGSALTARGGSESTGFSTLGLRLSKNFDLSGAKGTATGTLGWRHAFGDVDPASVFSANGTSLFAITGAPIAKNALVLGVGLDVEIAQGTTLGVSYNGQVGDHVSDHGVKGNFSVKF